MRCRISSVCLALLAIASAASAEDWFILDGVNGWTGSNLKHPVAAKLKEAVSSRSKLSSIAIAPDGNWVVLSGNNGYSTSKPDMPVCKRLAENQTRNPLHCVAFAPNGGWAFFFGQDGFWAKAIPDIAFQTIDQIRKRGKLRSVAFAPGGGWVLLHDEVGVEHEGIPPELAEILGDAVKKRQPIRCVAFADTGDWFVLGANAFWTSNVDHPAAKALAKLRQGNKDVRWIAFAPSDVLTSRYRIEAKPAQRVKAELTTDIAHPKAKVDEWLLFAPMIPDLPGQQDVQTAFAPNAIVVYDLGVLHRPLLLAKVADGSKEVHAVLTVEATLMSRHLVPLGAGKKEPEVKDLSPAEADFYTRASPILDYESKAFKSWVTAGKLQREPGESDMNFARRAFVHIKHHDVYEYPTNQHSASQVCVVGKSDCGGISCQFAALMRSEKIPARLIAGRWAESEKGKDTKTYVKAEFFGAGVGWVPVDCSLAVGDKNGPEYAFFGHERGDFLAFAADQDFVIDTIAFGNQRIDIFQGIAHWWRGSGPSTDSRRQERWTVTKEKTPAGAR
jgi:Transglutaminase-like superfamily